MSKFIVFSTLGQAKNFVKRKLPTHYHSDGCGCCYSESYPLIRGKRLLYVRVNSTHGNTSAEVIVIGRYKR